MEEKVGAVAAYAKMSWPQLIDAMWDAEEAERKAAAVPAETESAEAPAPEAADPADDDAEAGRGGTPMAGGAVNIDAKTGKYRSPLPSRLRRFVDGRHAMRRSIPPRRPLGRSTRK